MIRIILWALGIYLLYKLIFDFIIPVFNSTQQIKQQFRDIQDQMKDQQSSKQNGTGPSPNGEKKVVGEYIDFEEVK